MIPSITDFLLTCRIPGKLIFCKVWGSHSHNTALPESDVDYMAVYLLPTRQVLSFEGCQDTYESEKPDVQAHEVAKFCRLLMKGNPGILEMLFTEKMCYEGSYWNEIKEHRMSFVSQKALRQYLGYAEAQMKRFEAHGGERGLHSKGGSATEKWSYHMARLLGDAVRMAHGLPPKVWKEDGERDLLMKFRRGEYSKDQVAVLFREHLGVIEALKPWPLPEEGDRVFLEDWLYKIRKNEMEA